MKASKQDVAFLLSVASLALLITSLINTSNLYIFYILWGFALIIQFASLILMTGTRISAKYIFVGISNIVHIICLIYLSKVL